MVLYRRVLYRERYMDTYMDVVKIVKGSLQPVAIKVQTLFSIPLPLPVDGMNFSRISKAVRIYYRVINSR